MFFTQVGKQFDALLVDTQAPDASNPVFFTSPQDSMAVSLPADTYCRHKVLQLNTCFLEITKDISLWCHVSLQKAVTWNKNKKWGSLLSISQLCFNFISFFITGHH